MNVDAVIKGWRRWRKVDVWYHHAYRLPISSMETTGMEPRRADSAVWFLLEAGATRVEQLHAPRPISYARLARVHSHEYLESLSDPVTLGNIFATDPSDIVVDEVMNSIRLAVGGTVAASRFALATGSHTLNLLGGFHHARPTGGGGFCPVNDVAVAIAALRARAFKGRIAVLDLDAHPPDGTAECLRDDPAVWIGSLSGSDWGPLPRVDEVVLAKGADDATYLEALDALLRRMPSCELAFVLAGGDVVKGDRLGLLGLTLKGTRARDTRVHEALREVPTVWLPAGGYHGSSWKILAGTGLVLSGRGHKKIPTRYDPVTERFAAIARSLKVARLSSDPEAPVAGKGADDFNLTAEDVDGLFGRPPQEKRLLGFYTREGIEYALYRYGLLDQIQRLGYREPRIEIDATGEGDRLRLFARHDGVEDILVDMVLERRTIAGAEYLFTHWLSLRNPKAQFSEGRPKLPGQDVPGLGAARELGELMAVMARRLGLAGVAVRPAWYHVAYAGRYRFRFVDPRRQGRFEALQRDLGKTPLLELTTAIAEGRVRLNGEPYLWEPDDYVFAPHAPPPSAEAEQAAREERARCTFTLRPPDAPTRTVPRGEGR